MPTDDFDALREYYDNEYYGRDRRAAGLPWHSRRIGARLGNVAGRNVLDVACGVGEWLQFFHEHGANVAGIDLSQKAIDHCKRSLPEGEFFCGPAESLPFADARFDLVTCMGSLEHFIDKPRALAEMRRVARDDATFVLLVPNAGFLTRRLGFYSGTQQTKVREDVYELSAWARLFEQAGLHVTEKWRDLHPLSWDWILRGPSLAWPLRAAQALALALWPLHWQYQVYHLCRRT